MSPLAPFTIATQEPERETVMSSAVESFWSNTASFSASRYARAGNEPSNLRRAQCVCSFRAECRGSQRRMYLPMRRWTDAAAVSELDRLAADLSARRLSDRTFVNYPAQPAHASTARHLAMSRGARMRCFRKLSVATGLPIATKHALAAIGNGGAGTVGWARTTDLLFHRQAL